MFEEPAGDELAVTREEESWAQREKWTRGLLSLVALVKLTLLQQDADKAAAAARAGDSASTAATKSAVVSSAVAVVVGAFLLRLGGRAALVSLLGLDLVADTGISSQVDQVLGFASGAGRPAAVAAFFGAWVVAKVCLLDFLSVALAFSSGLLFGGVLEGGVMSSLGATLGSLCGFYLSRTLLKDRIARAVESRPVARALATVVAEEGFKTVLVLRLAPLPALPQVPRPLHDCGF